MAYHWIITEDQIGTMCAGVRGPSASNWGAITILDKEAKEKFRMLDDDGVVYYIGYLVGGEGFEPLDDFGTPNSGCTEIQY